MFIFCHRRCKLCFLHTCVVDIAVILYDSSVYFLLFCKCQIDISHESMSVHPSFVCFVRITRKLLRTCIHILHKFCHRNLRRAYPGQVAPRKSPVGELSEQPICRHLQHIPKLCLVPVIDKNLRPQSTGRYQQLVLVCRKIRHHLQIIRLIALMTMLAHSQNCKGFLIPDQEPQVKIIR